MTQYHGKAPGKHPVMKSCPPCFMMPICSATVFLKQSSGLCETFYSHRHGTDMAERMYRCTELLVSHTC